MYLNLSLFFSSSINRIIKPELSPWFKYHLILLLYNIVKLFDNIFLKFRNYLDYIRYNRIFISTNIKSINPSNEIIILGSNVEVA